MTAPSGSDTNAPLEQAASVAGDHDGEKNAGSPTPNNNGTLNATDMVLHPVAVRVPGETDTRLYLVPGAGSGDFETAAVLTLDAGGPRPGALFVVEF
ncbi:uncharacterized protein BDZ99DRAFT_514113 [Mytilinidion resinicola]|uniref:Uncharacterized protein n=1 Tax=Mytilinidion resinicola TaxID=574789 RepID=A0A6A6ZB11_9PEZI|nr:uncharacterized protein BDZ99DRAFT_514113 [Mytilinidion resinicola]KAF2817893.1 hypothetical protein BDZ99DRAFT_514113 [Mytilinidion resinicola]